MIQRAIIARLGQISAVTTLVGTRIWLDRLPMNPELPAIRVQTISSVEPMHLRGSSGLHRWRVQVDAYSGLASATAAGDPADEAQRIDAALHGPGDGSGLCGWRGVIAGYNIRSILPADRREDWDAEELNQYRVIRDYWVHWRQ